MSRTNQAEQLEIIFSIITQQPEGVGIASLEEMLARQGREKINRRTLQRRLEKLLKERRIITEGKGGSRMYRPGPGQEIEPFDVPLSIPVSEEGAHIREYVARPLMYRRPAGYERDFLLSYEPGKTFYLSNSLREQLHEIGRTPQGERPAGTYARDMLARLLVDLSWASSRLEGNTYSRLDTRNLIELGQVAKGKDAQETQMILNHKAAIELLVDEAEEVGFNLFTFQNLHAVLAQNLMPDEDACGRLRRRAVDISGTVFLPLAMPQQVEEYFRIILEKADAIPDPFEQAFFLMVQIPYLQPFEDVNKRVSRIGANISLIKHNVCPLSFIDVPESSYVQGLLGVYELNRGDLLRDVFVWAYERSCQRYLAITKSLDSPDPLKIRYREELIEGVRGVVLALQAPTRQMVMAQAKRLVPEGDWEAFSGLLQEALLNLHEGSVFRYRVRRLEFLAWEEVRGANSSSHQS